MHTDRKSLWNSIEHMSGCMFALAEEGNWTDLETLERQRKVCILDYFSMAVQPNDANRLAHGVQHILDIDKQIRNLCQQKKDSLGNDLSQFQTSRRAKKAYLQNSL